jgi:tryptophanyl-tRNA synthetase
MTDDEKYIHKEELTLEDTKRMGRNNVKDIIAFGFDPAKTFIFMDSDYIGTMYPNILKVSKHVTLTTIKSVFGFKESDNIGKFAFPPT